MQRKTGSGHPGRTSPSGISERVTVEEYHTSTNNMRPIDGVLGESPSAREAVRSKERQSMKGITDSAKNTAGVFDVSMLASGEINSGRDIFYSLLPRIFSSSNAEIVWNDSGPLGLKFDELGREAITRKLGFRRGDIIQRINGQEIISPRSLRTIAPAAAAGFLEIVVLRDGEPHKIEIDLAHAIGRF
ncbi:MAG: hypothetical protein DCC75_04275 [Proteobacteria bacterium]|nr:MAG: hypothetical protein DCC75_04275 [Pseudomonadota bacterium]